MNFIKSTSLNKFRAVRILLAPQSTIVSRAISTAPPPLLNQPLARCLPFTATTVRHIHPLPNPDNSWRLSVSVPEKKAFVVERLGKFLKVLTTGRHLLIPCVDKIAYAYSLKEEAITITDEIAITKDAVHIRVDAVLFLGVIDPKLASYEIDNPLEAAIHLARSIMRSELRKFTLVETFQGKNMLNEKIMISFNEAAKQWGIQCLRYEIRDIYPQQGGGVSAAMEMEGILDSKGEWHAPINMAQKFNIAEKIVSVILESEVAMLPKGERHALVNIAEKIILVVLESGVSMLTKGEAEALLARAQGIPKAFLTRAKGIAKGIELVSKALKDHGGVEATSLRIAEQYIQGLSMIIEASNMIAKELGDISPPRGVRAAMEMEAEAERKKRAQILESQGEVGVVLAKAQGEAKAILARAQGIAKGMELLLKALKEHGRVEATSLRIAEQYIHAVRMIIRALSMLAKELGDISPPRGVRASMEMESETDRKKRAQILESQVKRLSFIAELLENPLAKSTMDPIKD